MSDDAGVQHFPIYPIKFVMIQKFGPAYAVQCTCGEEFIIDQVINDDEIAMDDEPALCPSCYALAGMTAADHAEALTEMLMYLKAINHTQKKKTQGCRGWIYSEMAHVEQLLGHANNSAPRGAQSYIRMEEVKEMVAVLEAGGTRALKTKLQLEQEFKDKWATAGPFLMFNRDGTKNIPVNKPYDYNRTEFSREWDH